MSIIHQKICRNCSIGFTSNNRTKAYCGIKCKNSFESRLPRKKENLKRFRRNNPDKKYRYPSKYQPVMSCLIYSIVCRVTGKVFTARTARAIYSPEGRDIAVSQYHANHYVSLRKEVTFNCVECGILCTSTTRTKYCGYLCSARPQRRIAKAVRRAKVKSTHDRVLVSVVLSKFNYHCASCGCETPLSHRGTYLPTAPELDHIIPLSKGGTHTYNNIQLLCRSCNAYKSDTITIDALQ